MTVAVVEFRAQDGSGNFLTDVDVEVREEVGGLPLATLYSDRAGTTTIGNPANFPDGIVRFYVAGGSYQIVVSKDAVTIDTFRNWAVGLLGEEDAFPATPVATDISYTSANSPADITNVQEAIDDIYSKLIASQISYTDSDSPPQVSTVQEAIDEKGVFWYQDGAGQASVHNLLNQTGQADSSGTIDVDSLHPGEVPPNATALILTIEVGYSATPGGGNGAVSLRVMPEGYNLGNILDRAKVQQLIANSTAIDVQAMHVMMPIHPSRRTFFWARQSTDSATANKMSIIDLWGYVV